MSKRSSDDIVGTSLASAVARLRRGGVVAFPTETYYGLAVDPYCRSAVEKIFRIKMRSPEKPLMLLIEDTSFLDSLVEYIPQRYQPLMNKYWPGPLTLIFPAKALVCQMVTAKSGTIGVRISSNPVAQALVKKMGKPLTATSANISGAPPAKSAAEVLAMFGDTIDYILDGGETGAGLCSTILAIKENQLTVMRQGQIDLPHISGVR